MNTYKDKLAGWFLQKIALHKKSIKTQYRYKKGDIWYVDFGVNIGNEFNNIRPAIILTDKKFSNGNNILVAPITTFSTEKNILQTDIIVTIKKKSIIKINHLRDISKKRLLKKIGRISDKHLCQIDTNLKTIFDIRQ